MLYEVITGVAERNRREHRRLPLLVFSSLDVRGVLLDLVVIKAEGAREDAEVLVGESYNFV